MRGFNAKGDRVQVRQAILGRQFGQEVFLFDRAVLVPKYGRDSVVFSQLAHYLASRGLWQPQGWDSSSSDSQALMVYMLQPYFWGILAGWTRTGATFPFKPWAWLSIS